ncbi:coiled-coil domain-containing protein AGAP005037-like [Pollicipes pollicipes]|uniref:coiled-coil domain-containing protein AGAP005037-like n=1 Tax=Pollicipes pollicipes TaxID=41117 RepID=UPI0018859C00|nr:coiled-coil domain-containing protein AGAP005037-like [Pollicipes pollicipes]
MDPDSNKSSSDSERPSAGSRLPPHGCPPRQDRRACPTLPGRTNSSRHQQQMRNYSSLPPSSTMFDDDPGIMSEAETSSTGFRRGAKVRSSLPVVRTPSKTMERPLGVVFLQYGSETKRALLPNEVTSLYTVKALFVRSFPRQLNMEYLDSSACKIYILDSSRDMFYDMEDLRDVRDRSVLRIFETGATHPPPVNGTSWEDNSYFSEPEFDGDYQSQHVHKAKGKSRGYEMMNSFPPGGRPVGTYPPRVAPESASTRPHRPGAGPPPKPQRAGYARGTRSPLPTTSTPARRSGAAARRTPAGPAAFDDHYYGQFRPPPLADDEARKAGFFDAPAARRVEPGLRYNEKVRVESMERQLANLTGMVQKALSAPRVARAASDLDSGYRSDRELYHRAPSDNFLKPDRPPKLGRGKDKSVSFEKSVSFSDDPHGPNKQHSPTHAADKVPVKPAIKSSTLPRMSSQERVKPPPPPKPVILTSSHDGRHSIYRDLHLSPETYNQLRSLQKKARDLRQEMRKLRRLSQEHSLAVKEMIGDTYSKIRGHLLSGSDLKLGEADSETLKIRTEEEAYREVIQNIEKDLSEVEHHVEDLRSNVINRQRRVNLNDVEGMALVLSKSSKTVSDLQKRFPELERSIRGLIAVERERVCREESFLGEEPQRLENALQRIKKLSGTLVTLKRLASVQEQRVPEPEDSSSAVTKPPDAGAKPAAGAAAAGDQPAAATGEAAAASAPGNPLDALLSELQTFSPERRPAVRPAARVVPMPGRLSPTPEEPAGRPAPPPPPPRTSSKSPLISPSSPLSPHYPAADENLRRDTASSNSSSSESVNSQEGLRRSATPGERPASADRGGVLSRSRQEALERRETELRRKQHALQQQYARLQAMNTAPRPQADIKKTGSDGDLAAKMGGLSLAPVTSGSVTDVSGQAGQQDV